MESALDLAVEPLKPQPPFAGVPQSQPIAALANLDPLLDDAAVREAIMKAEANNQNPMTVSMSEMAQAPAPVVAAPAPVVEAPKQEVPQKFQNPNGEVDVEKLQASTRQLEEAIQQKETKLQEAQEAKKSADDMLSHYLELEKKFKNTQNPDRVMAQIPTLPVNPTPQMMSDQQLLAMINEDMKNNPAQTVASLVELAISKRLAPQEEKERIGTVRENIERLTKQDARFLQHFDAITRKIESDPDIRSRKNPHRAAWLEVKEELRLGEPQAQAQPSKPLSPVLGGGTPASAPLVSAHTPQNVIANLDKIDLRDKRQEAMADAAVRAFLAGGRG